jgi:hypothetical protein
MQERFRLYQRIASLKFQIYGHKILLWFRVQGIKIHWYVASVIFWLIAPMFYEQQKWVGPAIEDVDDKVDNLQVDHSHLDDEVCGLEGRIEDLEAGIEDLEAGEVE